VCEHDEDGVQAPAADRLRQALTQALRWRLDRIVARGTGAMVATLSLIVVACSVCGGAITLALSSGGLGDAIWTSVSRMLDGGSHQHDGAWSQRLFSLVLVILGRARRAPRAAAAPVLCAVGGMVVPMLIYRAFVPAGAGAAGWAIPSATDVALAVGIAALVAPRLSAGARAFLLTLAVADDLGGIAVIGIWYSDGIALLPALGALGLALLAALAVRAGVLTLGRALWLVVPALGLMHAAHIEPRSSAPCSG
jgi:hypothetical protein